MVKACVKGKKLIKTQKKTTPPLQILTCIRPTSNGKLRFQFGFVFWVVQILLTLPILIFKVFAKVARYFRFSTAFKLKHKKHKVSSLNNHLHSTHPHTYHSMFQIAKRYYVVYCTFLGSLFRPNSAFFKATTWPQHGRQQPICSLKKLSNLGLSVNAGAPTGTKFVLVQKQHSSCVSNQYLMCALWCAVV